MTRSRLSAAFYLILVFATGMIVGVVVHRLYTASSASANTTQPSPEEWRKRYLSQMKSRIGANDEQIARVNAILDTTKRRFDEVHAQEKKNHDQLYQEQIAAVKGVLNPQQQAAYDTWREERRRERDKAQKK